MATPAHNAKNVLALSPKATGGIMTAPLGTKLPTSLSDPLDSAFVSLGYVSEDGVTESVARDVEKKKAWGNMVVKILTTDHEATWQFQLMETSNMEAMKAVYGKDAVSKSGDSVKVNIEASELPEQSFVFEMVDKGNDVSERIVLPKARVTEIGDLVYTHGDISVFDVTLEALEDEKGVKGYKYTSLTEDGATENSGDTEDSESPQQ